MKSIVSIKSDTHHVLLIAQGDITNCILTDLQRKSRLTATRGWHHQLCPQPSELRLQQANMSGSGLVFLSFRKLMLDVFNSLKDSHCRCNVSGIRCVTLKLRETNVSFLQARTVKYYT